MTPRDPVNPYAPPKASLDSDVEGKTEHVVSPEWVTVTTFADSREALDATRLLDIARIDSRIRREGESSVASVAIRSGAGRHLVQVSPANLPDAANVLGVAVDPDASPLPEFVSDGDDRMRQALIVSVLGTLFCPGISHIGSIIAVILTPAFDLTARGLKLRRWAIAINLTVIAVLATLAFVRR
jgi:hypothetical protein